MNGLRLLLLCSLGLVVNLVELHTVEVELRGRPHDREGVGLSSSTGGDRPRGVGDHL